MFEMFEMFEMFKMFEMFEQNDGVLFLLTISLMTFDPQLNVFTDSIITSQHRMNFMGVSGIMGILGRETRKCPGILTHTTITGWLEFSICTKMKRLKLSYCIRLGSSCQSI